jgi:stage III sporulation protein SpoIIIAA
MNNLKNRGGGPCAPITIRGVTYPSRQAAADALGVHRTTIQHALKNNALHTVGMGSGRMGKTRAIRDIVSSSARLLEAKTIEDVRWARQMLRDAHARLNAFEASDAKE